MTFTIEILGTTEEKDAVEAKARELVESIKVLSVLRNAIFHADGKVIHLDRVKEQGSHAAGT